jgi:hypothetical protein
MIYKKIDPSEAPEIKQKMQEIINFYGVEYMAICVARIGAPVFKRLMREEYEEIPLKSARNIRLAWNVVQEKIKGVKNVK